MFSFIFSSIEGRRRKREKRKSWWRNVPFPNRQRRPYSRKNRTKKLLNESERVFLTNKSIKSEKNSASSQNGADHVLSCKRNWAATPFDRRQQQQRAKINLKKKNMKSKFKQKYLKKSRLECKETRNDPDPN